MSDVPGVEDNDSDHSRESNWGVDWSKDVRHSVYDQDTHPSQQVHPSRFDEDSMSGGVLLYNLDCGTLEPPSPQPPSPERQGGGRENVGTERGQQSTGIGRRKKRREKRTMTSLYVRYCLACLFLFHALSFDRKDNRGHRWKDVDDTGMARSVHNHHVPSTRYRPRAGDSTRTLQDLVIWSSSTTFLS